MKLLSVEGSPRSGTTMLQQMINSHPNAVCMHEFGLNRLIHTVEEFFVAESEQNKQLSTLASWGKDLKQNWFSKGMKRVDNIPTKDDFLVPRKERDFSLITKNIFEVISNKKDIKIGGDKNPFVNNPSLWRLRDNGFSIKTITIIRNPISVVKSSLHRFNNTLIGDDTWHINSIDDALEEWIANWESAANRAAQANPDDLFIRYEDLLNDFDIQSRLITDHLEINGKLSDIVNYNSISTSDNDENEFYVKSLLGGIVDSWETAPLKENMRAFRNIKPFNSLNITDIISCHNNNMTNSIFFRGFSKPEFPGGIWTNAHHAAVRYHLDKIPPSCNVAVRMDFTLFSFGEKISNFKICDIDNNEIDYIFEKNGKSIIFTLNHLDGWLEFNLIINDTKELHENPVHDPRKLGVKIESIKNTIV